MIRRVRRQFILITMSMLTTVLLVPLVALNVITSAMSYNQTRDLQEQIAISEAAARKDFSNLPDDLVPSRKPDGTSADDTETTPPVTTETVESTTTTQTMTEAMTAEQAAPVTSAAKSPQAVPSQTVQTTVPITTTKVVSRETNPVTTTAARTTHPIHTTVRATTTKIQTTRATTPPFFPNPDPDPEPHPWYASDHEMAILPSGIIQMLAAGQSKTTVTTATSAVTTTETKNLQKPDGIPDPPLWDRKKDAVTIDHFLCFADSSGNLMQMEGTSDYTEADGQELLDYVVEKGKQDGKYGSLQYFQKELPDGFLVVFSDRSAEQLLMKKLFFVSVSVFLCMEGVVFILTMRLTKRAMRPMQATFERQRQFISDAGHELKTPLTIISANVDILQDEIGQNKWLTYIQSQTERMRILVGDMMNLTKMEFGNPQKNFTTFSLSSAISNASLPFESQAFEQQKQLILEIQDDLQYFGNPDQIKQLVSIFIDNAIKYSDEKGEIRVTLQQVRDKKILKIFNTGKGIIPSEKEKIFERFYRSDSSRARQTGGYGLGLSIAKSIADTHKIKIQVETEYEHWICFILTL